MSIHVALNHRTTYTFDRSTTIHPHVLRLRPAVHCRTPILAYSLKVQPENHFINWQQDPFGNYLARLVFPERARALAIEVDLIADMTVINPFEFFLDEDAREVPFDYGERLSRDLAPYLEAAPVGARLDKWLKGVDRKPRATVDFLVGLNQQLADQIEYSIRMEPGVQTPEQTLEKRRGSCRDSAWLLVQILRNLGLAARFASGYLVQLTADQRALDGPSGPTADFTDLHAWTEVYVPGAGWIGLDPTSGLLAGEGHIPLSCTPEPGSAAPVTGATSECDVAFDFSNRVTRIHEDPRVTLPYDDANWSRIQALGAAVDDELDASDVRLTMGGEPTFVSIDDAESAQWNTAADGEHKRERAELLVRRLREEFAPGGLLHYGQGKWYPGEPLPRWQKGCFWRTDGHELWQDPELLAAPDVAGTAESVDARQFLHRVVQCLSLSAEAIVPAFEDPVHHVWQEGLLPEDLHLEALNLADARERRALLSKLEGDLSLPVGQVLPLEYSEARAQWQSSPWPLRRRRLYLLPGDSAIGFRLPLDSLPWHHGEEDPPPQPPDPFAERTALARPEAAETAPRLAGGWAAEGRVVKTALAVEVRNGNLHVFLPPIELLEPWVDLMRVLEHVAGEMSVPVVLEGYDPPRDPRLCKLAVTPDPGVIEVNIHPADSFRELSDHTERLYEIARECRLTTEKFMLDGRHTGTGGGNHVTLGGATPADSPLLRRPSLLRSLITYWQVHPSLSYLFSGLFIGPTSQAPRVDEARDDRLYELEIALAQLPDDDVAQPWLVDRALRNQLTDLTGNTHRSEFCIDKLYSPDSATGRLGLLELRAFEMPPHARMSVVQMLLLRALVAWFWREPLQRPLVHWGTQLHDRFMLPHYVWEDLREVVTDLRAAGFALELDWFAPFFEFRFPRLGHMQVGDLDLEVRGAIEPWHVLGEEASGSGTARYVDSSVERLQVRLQGIVGERHVLTCNGRRVPLRSTGVRGEAVAGVRYKAWAPPSALHPSIGVDVPLVFDVIDRWNGRSLGGCTYHVAHAGGRNFESFPVNANEAESRRVSRFQDFGHSPGAVEPRPIPARTRGEFRTHDAESAPTPNVGSDREAGRAEEVSGRRGRLDPPPLHINPDYPLTLDLRRG